MSPRLTRSSPGSYVATLLGFQAPTDQLKACKFSGDLPLNTKIDVQNHYQASNAMDANFIHYM